MTTIGIIGSALTITVLLLKYYPEWSRKRSDKQVEVENDEFGEALLGGDAGNASVLLAKRLRDKKRGRGAAGQP